MTCNQGLMGTRMPFIDSLVLISVLVIKVLKWHTNTKTLVKAYLLKPFGPFIHYEITSSFVVTCQHGRGCSFH